MRLVERMQLSGGRQWVCSRARGDVLKVAVGTGMNLPFYPADLRLTGDPTAHSSLDQQIRPIGVDQRAAGKDP